MVRRASALLLVLVGVAACRPKIVAPDTSGAAAAARDPRWAHYTPEEGVPNLYKVSDGLYRSGQPNAEGFQNLAKLGVKTVVNLRATHSDAGKIGSTPLEYVSLPTVVWEADEGALLAFLRVASDPTKRPVVVHCTYGADRTGAAVALYRMVVEGWSREDAIREMVDGGFGFHETWQNLIEFIETVDVVALRQKLLAPKPPPPL
ncbi:MAG: tyrosine-protein phosphatase [Polyangiaceae bacterium]